ncbi:MAG: hypothetical protein H6Q89_4413, partial [Myxococcaceae bacterium]|nr:hypothetical protein [Myxococcaceae bacterium]
MSHAPGLACPRRMNRILCAVAVLGLTAACSENLPPSPEETSPDLSPSVVRQAQLLAYPNCTQLDRAAKARLIAVMRANLAASFKSALAYMRSDYYGYSTWGGQDAGSSGGSSGGAGGS